MSGEPTGPRSCPLYVELRAARGACEERGPGARERYMRALGAVFEADAAWAESVADQSIVHRRRVMAMRTLFEIFHPPLAMIAFAFKATTAELSEAFDGLPALAPERTETEISRLRALPYEAYLRTEHWMKVRAAALERFENRCAMCFSGRELEAHHRTYKNLGCELPADVTVVCARCHAHFHDEIREQAA